MVAHIVLAGAGNIAQSPHHGDLCDSLSSHNDPSPISVHKGGGESWSRNRE